MRADERRTVEEPTQNPNWPDDAPAIENGPVQAYREVVLEKHGQRYVFRYALGQEQQLLANLTEMARDPASPIGWFDAAVVSHQMGVSLGTQLSRLRNAR